MLYNLDSLSMHGYAIRVVTYISVMGILLKFVLLLKFCTKFPNNVFQNWPNSVLQNGQTLSYKKGQTIALIFIVFCTKMALSIGLIFYEVTSLFSEFQIFLLTSPC